MNELEKKKKLLNAFISGCKQTNGESVPDGYTYQDISKIVCEQYPTQTVEIIKIYFKTKGKTNNNKPYTYHEELPEGTYKMLVYDLREARSNIHFNYKSITEQTKTNSIYIDPDLISSFNEGGNDDIS